MLHCGGGDRAPMAAAAARTWLNGVKVRRPEALFLISYIEYIE